jgi:hypothetical protein
MASISTDPSGNRTVQFVAPDGKRRSVLLGKVPMTTAEEVRRRVEYLWTYARAWLRAALRPDAAEGP